MLRTICILCCAFMLTACASSQSQTPSYKAEGLQAAKADCLKEAREMSNEDLDPDNASDNAYFSMCMQTKYGYTWEQVRHM